MKTVPISIQRGNAEISHVETFDVPYRDGMSILDALIWVRTHADPSLAFRYSCINANACKECVVKVDGKTDYACTARLAEGGVTVRPLSNKSLIRDLVAETAPPKERLDVLISDKK